MRDGKAGSETCDFAMPENAMDRRALIRQAVIVLGGSAAAGAFSACQTTPARTERVAGQAGRYFDGPSFALLEHVAETMLPETETPGARSANVHGFVDAMMADWAIDATRSQFKLALAIIDQEALAGTRKRFVDLSPAECQSVVASIDERSFAQSPTVAMAPSDSAAYRRLKWLIFLGYWTSEPANPHYRLNPGVYRGDLSASERDALLGKEVKA